MAAARDECSAAHEDMLEAVADLGLNPTEQLYLFDEIGTRHRLRWDMRPPQDDATAFGQLVPRVGASQVP